MMLSSLAVNIHKVRLHSGGRDPFTVQNRLAQLLSRMDAHPPGLPAFAILCVRSLPDPLPRTVHWHQRELQLPSVWERTVRTTLDDLVRTASRPVREAVPANARAVLFVDQAELLACLAKDWCEGRIVSRWWWRSLFPGADLNDVVLRAWREAPTYIPAALEILAEQQSVKSFVRALPTNEALPLLQSLLVAFALRDLRMIFGSQTSDFGPRTLDSSPEAAEHRLQPPIHNPQSLTPPPWHRWVPEALESQWSREQQCLLGIGLMLSRASFVVRSTSFAQSLRHWIEVEPRVSLARDDGIVGASSAAVTLESPVSKRQGTREAQRSSSLPLPDENLSGVRQLDNQSLARNTSPERQSPIAHSESEQDVTAEAVTVPTPVVTITDSTATFSNRGSDSAPTSDGAEAFVNEAWAEEHVTRMETAGSIAPVGFEPEKTVPRRETQEIETAYGGIFYMVNLGLFLGLYGDFTNPLQPGISLPLWDFVALVGRELVGSELEADPVWTLLAELAERHNGEEPGTGFVPSEEMWKTVDDGLMLRSLTPGVNQSYTNELTRWLNSLMPYIRLRLQRALGLTAEDELAAVLCYHRARVSTTATHVDIHLSLAELPIAIRLAGLDRDPGWVPAAGCYVTFHFE